MTTRTNTSSCLGCTQPGWGMRRHVTSWDKEQCMLPPLRSASSNSPRLVEHQLYSLQKSEDGGCRLAWSLWDGMLCCHVLDKYNSLRGCMSSSCALYIYGRGQRWVQLSPPCLRHSNSVDQHVCDCETAATFPVAPASKSGRVSTGEMGKASSTRHPVQWSDDTYFLAVPILQQVTAAGSYM